ncbi:MAG: MBOAT family protein [Bacteroidaceae bacterium]|nr:MBOAT family protein [Bacteroidaceae bacterium]
MRFNSFEFLIFLPVVFLLYWHIFRGRRWQNLLIVIASYVFYGWWDWRFLCLIAVTSLSSFGSGLLLERCEGHPRWRKLVCGSNIAFNLAILGTFKYYNFFVENLEALLRTTVGYELDWVTLKVILPVGISFYTFQALSYTIDVYRRQLPATRGAIEFFAYISFFPQLVAGPIERARNLLPQFQQARHFDRAKAVDGLRQMLWGFTKKMVVADSCAVVVNEHWSEYAQFNGLTLFVLALLFTFQIYCDFSGYSDIAIGSARLFGFNLMRNFNYPYFSRSIPEFWRRWHISLMTWFRDYVYIPLGGSRCGRWKTVRNIYIVWGISGLWHAANWTYVSWGLFHATLLTIYLLLGIQTKYKENVAHGRLLPNVREVLQMGLTFSLVVVSFIFVRSEDLQQTLGFMRTMFLSMFDGCSLPFGKTLLLYSAALLVVEWLQREKQHALQFSANGLLRHRWMRWAVYYVLLVLISQKLGNEQTFIYFQF